MKSSADTVNTGIYILEPEVLDAIPDQENMILAKTCFKAVGPTGPLMVMWLKVIGQM